MRRSYCALLLTTIILSAPTCLAQDGLTLRVLCYNIHHAEGVDRSLDLPRIARVIRSVNPDIVALQEVDREVARTDRVDQPAEIAKLTGMEFAFGGNITLQGGEYGNALLSKLPIAKAQNRLLPNLDAGEQRGVLEVEIRVSQLEKPLLFLVTHLDHRRDEQERIESVKMINQLVTDRMETPAIFAGDLNATPESKPLQMVRELWQQTNETPALTIPVDSPTKQIDFIFVRPANRWRVKEFRVLDESIASDHRAIFAVLELK